MINVNKDLLLKSIIESLETYQISYIVSKFNMNRMNGIYQSHIELIEESLTITPPPLAEVEMLNYVLNLKSGSVKTSISPIRRTDSLQERRLKRLEEKNIYLDGL